jgi:hypothetical protein
MNGGIKKSIGHTFLIGLPVFQALYESVTHQEESQASAIDRTVQPVPPAKEEAVVATGVAILRMVTCLVAGFG